MSVTSAEIVHICSCHARTITWGEHEQLHMFSACTELFFTLESFLLSQVFSYEYLERYFLWKKNSKNSKFKSERRGTDKKKRQQNEQSPPPPKLPKKKKEKKKEI